MILTIASRPPLIFEASDILSVDGWQQAAGGESPTLTVRLDPARLAVYRLDPPPLRAPAALIEGVSTLFLGIVQAVRLGADPIITLES